MKKLHEKIKLPFPGDDNPVLAIKDLIIETCKLKPSHNTLVQLARSLVVSVIALIVDFGGLVILKEFFGINYLVAATLSFLMGVTVNYFMSIWWVFANRKLASKKNGVHSLSHYLCNRSWSKLTYYFWNG